MLYCLLDLGCSESDSESDAVLYVFVGCFVVRGCAVTRRYVDVCDCDMFGVV